jgi:hypothetical protein
MLKNMEKKNFGILQSLFTHLRFVLFVVAIGLAHVSLGGMLDDLEKEVSEKSASKAEKKKSQTSTYDDAANSSFGSGTYPSSGGGESFLGEFWIWLFHYQYGDPSASTSPDGVKDSYSIYPQHTLGQATAPYVRIDYNWQEIDSQTDAQDFRVEVGYKLVAFHGRTTRYDDGSSTLDINQYYGVLRYGGYRPDFLPGTFEFGIGFGGAQIKGNSEDSSGALTIPLKYYPADWCGIEFRPAWYEWMDISARDYDLSISFGQRFVQLRGGYRWLSFQGVDLDLDGPYAGISISF